MTCHKISFFASLPRFVKTLLRIVLRNYKTSFIITYATAIAAIVGIVFMRKVGEINHGGMGKALATFDNTFLIYDNHSVNTQCSIIDVMNHNKVKQNPGKTNEVQPLNQRIQEGFTFIVDIERPNTRKKNTLDSHEIYKLFKEFTNQTGIDSFQFFAGGQFEFNKEVLSKIKTVVNFFKFPIKQKKMVSIESENKNKVSSSNSAFLHNQYVTKALRLDTPEIFFPQRDTPSILQNGPLVMFVSFILFAYTMMISSNISFYKDLIASKITKFLNLIGYSLLVQFIATHLVSIIMTLPLTIPCAIVLQQFLTNTGELAIQEITMNVIWLIHLQFVLNCVTLSLYNLLPIFLMSMVNFIVSLGFFAMSLQRIPGEEDTYYKILYYISPINAIVYFLWFQVTTGNRTLAVFKHLKVPFKNTTLLTILLIQLSLSIFFTLLSYILYKLDTDIVTTIYSMINKALKNLYNLIIRKNKLEKITEDNNDKIKRKINLEETKDILVINKLCKSYTTFGSKIRVLKNIDLEINKGEKIALLGHNGCGKTTFIDSLTGIIKRSSGEVYLNRKKINGTTDLQAKLGYCPQFTKTIPSLNVIENLQLVSNLYNVSKSDTVSILKDLDIYKQRKKQANQLSGGQKRKLGFAMAVISSAPLIILDEPTTGIDVLSRKTIFELLRKYSKDSMVIFSTHLIEEAENYADKVAILSQGELMAFDTVTNIKRRFNIIYNRLQINFLDKANKDFINQLTEEYKLEIVNEMYKTVSLEIKETNYSHLAKLYEFMEDKRNKYGVESYGIYKASLEEVLNLQEFRELKTNSSFNKYTIIENKNDINGEVPFKNTKKKPSILSTLKALFYHTLISIFTNLNTLVYLIVISLGVFLSFGYSRNTTNNSNKSFKTIQFNTKSFELNNVRKAKIKTFDITDPKNKQLVEFVKGQSSMKEFINIEEIPQQRITEIFDKSTINKKEIEKFVDNQNKANKNNKNNKDNKNNKNGNKDGDNEEYNVNDDEDLEQIKDFKISQRILALTNSEEYDLFIFEITKKRLKDMFNIEYLLPDLRNRKPKDVIKGNQIQLQEENKEKNILLALEQKLLKEKVLIIIQKYNDDIYSILFSFLFTEYQVYTINLNRYNEKHKKSVIIDKFNKNNNKDEEINYKFEQEVILNKDHLLKQEELRSSNFITFFIFTIFAFSISLISDRLIDEKESGIQTLWHINGIPKLVMFIFNIMVYSALTFLAMAVPVRLLNIWNYRSIASFLMDTYLIYLLACIILLALLFGFLSHILSKPAIMGIKNGIISLTFLTHMLKGIFSLFVKSNKVQYYMFWNPFYIYYETLLIILRGEIHLKTRSEYYMFYNTSTKPIYLGNWGMSNYIQVYFLNYITIETCILFIASIMAVFKILTLLNESIKRIEFKNVKSLSNLNKRSYKKNNNERIKGIDTEKKVELKNVTKIYGHRIFFNSNYALSNFNLQANQGDSIGVLGANGGGKTTAFKLLTGELEPTFGDIYLANKRISNTHSSYMGYVPQYEALPQQMTPYQVLKFYAILNNWEGNKTEKYLQHTLDLMKLKKNKYKKINILSGGNKRKVVLAISIMLNKDLLVLDEPTTGVDITNCQDIWDVVQERTENKTMLLASHSTRESEQLTNKIIILIDGRIVASGTKETIREEHGKYYEVEVEMYENDPELDGKLMKLKEKIEGKFETVRIDIRNNFKFSCFVEKKQIRISELIELFAKWRQELDINEFFVNESTLEDILRVKLAEKRA